MTAYRLTSCFLLLALATAAHAGDAEADKKAIDGIIQEIELVPSLYAKYPGSLKPKPAPKVLAKKLADHLDDKDAPLDKERATFQANRARYAKAFPLRAAIFDAADETEQATKLDIRLVIFKPITPMKKAVFMKEQEAQGMAIFKLEQVFARMQELEKQRDQEKSKRWQANFDVALTRLQANLIFLMEHDYALGRIRADALPDLKPANDGWRLTFIPKITASEKKAKDLVKSGKNRWEKIQADHPDTPWAHFAERESQRSLGMEWRPWAAKKK